MKRTQQEKQINENIQRLTLPTQTNAQKTTDQSPAAKDPPQQINQPQINQPQFTQRYHSIEKEDWLVNLHKASALPEHKLQQQWKGFMPARPKLDRLISHDPAMTVLTEDMTSQLILPLMFNDLDTCVRIAGVPNLQALMQIKVNSGMTVLQFATKHGCTEAITTLLKTQADSQQIAGMNDFSELANGMPISSQGIVESITDIDERKIKALMEEERSKHIAEQNEKTALRSVIKKGSIELVKILLNSELDTKRRQELVTKHAQNEKSLWWCAVKHLYAEIVKILLGNVPEPNQRQHLLQLMDKDGKSALQIAASHGNPTMVRYLLQAADDDQTLIFQKDNDGMNAFMHAASEGNTVSALIVFDMTSDKPALLRQFNKKQIYTNAMMTIKLRKIIKKRLIQIMQTDSREEIKLTIKILENKKMKNVKKIN